MYSAGGSAPGTVLDNDVWATDALTRLCVLPDVSRAGLAISEGGGRRLLFTSAEPDARPEREPLTWCHVDAYDDVPLNTAVRRGEVVTGSLNQLARRYPEFVARQHRDATRGLAAAPIRHDDRTLGGFVLFYARPQRFSAGQRASLASLGEELGRALALGQPTEPSRRHTLRGEPVGAGVVAYHDVPPDPSAVARARHFLATTLAEWPVPSHLADVAVLCLSELVTNSLVHSREGCEVRIHLRRRVLTATVRDSGPVRVNGREGYDDPLRVHGRGLQIVEALSSRWGSDVVDGSTTVWFDLAI